MSPKFTNRHAGMPQRMWNQSCSLHLASVCCASFLHSMILPISWCCTWLGVRSCIGRKFAVTEAVAFLAMLLRDWRVEPLMKMGESKDEWRKRAFEVKLTLTLGIEAVPVKLVRRHQQSWGSHEYFVHDKWLSTISCIILVLQPGRSWVTRCELFHSVGQSFIQCQSIIWQYFHLEWNC